ncbi:hypothetical protein [Bradyrhizobium sp. WYCCWR 12699]|uniref:hypothetical protein n=1 Tax=Bradyrhizobium sp. WYCCWR 12699 TaxID=3064203 RepID=UPI0028A4497A|nr:hypothetical protein [Bradyrhizobium sp. WYCCWR 12699]MDT4740264.1 hypothetical protein [Bradyrhizobium sp. WYCCWR 12699]
MQSQVFISLAEMFWDSHVDEAAGPRWRTAMRYLSVALLFALPVIPIAADAQQTEPKSQSGVAQSVQTEADKGIKTRNSGESGYVGNQDRPGAASHAPGETTNTVGTTTGSSATGNQSNINSSQADYDASLKDGSAPKK